MGEQELQLIIPEKPQDRLALFMGEFNMTISPLLKPIGAEVVAFLERRDADKLVETEDGRKEIASFAYKLARSKSALEAVGKAVADEVKKIPKRIDENRKSAREQLEAWQITIRAPLDKWEAAEEDRIDAHVARIALIRQDAIGPLPSIEATADDLAALIGLYEVMVPDNDAREFAEEYRLAIAGTLGALRTRHQARVRYDLRASQARQEAIQREAQAAQDKIDREREAAEAAKALAESNRLREIAEAEAAKDRAALAIAEAERRRLEAQQAETRAAEARERDRLAVEVEQKAEALRVEARRQENRAHQGAVNRKAREAIGKIIAATDAHATLGNRDFSIAEILVTAIAKGEIPGVTINY